MNFHRHNRLRAYKKLRLEPWIEDAENVTDPFAFVMSMNYHRRHLSELARGEALTLFFESQGGKNGYRGNQPKSQDGPLTVNSLAKQLGIPKATAHRQMKAAKDYRSLPKLLKAKVDAGDVSVKVAKQAAGKVQRKIERAKSDGALPKSTQGHA